MSNKNFILSVLSKLLITVSFVGVLSFVLYAPKLYDYFVRPENEISVYTFMDVISTEIFHEFEEKTGIRVRISYVENNEELLAKFKISKGKGYDLITPSDFIVRHLKNQNLLQEIDHSKLSNLDHLDKRLFGHYFDKQNKYSIPVAWATYGIGFNKKYVSKITSWDSAFHQDLDIVKHWGAPYKICMPDDIDEAAAISSMYLFGKVGEFTQKKLKQIERLLKKQKKQVERYTISSLKYFLYSDVVPLVITFSAVMKMIMEETDQFDFVIPKEGSIVTIENVAIPAASKNADLVHKLIDFILSKKMQIQSFDVNGYNPSNTQCYGEIDKKFRKHPAFFPSDKKFSKLNIVRDVKQFEKLWLKVKTL